MLLKKTFLVSLFTTLAVGQTTSDASSSGTPSSTKHAKHSAVRSVTHFPSGSKNATVKANSSSSPVTTVTETVALSLVLDILGISVQVASHTSSAHAEKSSESRHSSRQKSSSSSSEHGCSVTTAPQVCCGGPVTTTATATVVSTVSQGFVLGTTSTRSSSSSTPSILSATSSSG
ncbi:uncharacterized protein BKCO1_1000296 [Diplodia corticola]|uniref:Uncharacterized protein n=1 Tax=Diplodia corticola TaxID=236234 RepID=A0A1J9SJB2_9PEZI|nr:uncharacterized protein BKCO1_1000296 [Diplodia corticola]OJD40439.1 hypothetical protein BKCO1_1000296 [Diplodia corticola]